MRLVFATVLATMLSMMPLPVLAETHEGVVRLIRIDSESDAPLCVATTPNMPNESWACIYTNRRHYREMMEMLLRALDAKHTCTFEWTHRDALTRRAQINILTCAAG